MASVPGATMTVGPATGTPFTELVPLASNTYLRNDGGRFLIETSGVWALAGAGSAQIDGWALDCFQVIHNGNQGKTPYPTTATYSDSDYWATITRDITTPDKGCWIPSADTLVAGNINLKCELIVSGSTTSAVQKVKPSVVTTPTVKIIAVDLINNYAKVIAIL